MTPTLKKPRPYWHVDAKWISGICLLLLLSFTSLVFIAWQVTDRPTGTTLLTTLLAEPLYDEGAQGLASLITDPELKKGVEENAKPLSFISAEMHSKLRGVLVASVVASLVFLGLLVFFSYRFGRIGSPGWVI